MKRMLAKLGTKGIEGFFILLPLLIAYLLLGQLVDLLLALTQPLMDVLPGVIIKDEVGRKVAAFGMLVIVFLLVGVAAHTRPAQRFGAWFEGTFLDRFPPYSVLKSLSSRLAGRPGSEGLQPAMLTVAPGMRMLAAIVEELPSGELTVFLPMAPTPGVGLLQIVAPDRVERLHCSMGDALGWPLNWGAGTESLFKPQR